MEGAGLNSKLGYVWPGLYSHSEALCYLPPKTILEKTGKDEGSSRNSQPRQPTSKVISAPPFCILFDYLGKGLGVLQTGISLMPFVMITP